MIFEGVWAGDINEVNPVVPFASVKMEGCGEMLHTIILKTSVLRNCHDNEWYNR